MTTKLVKAGNVEIGGGRPLAVIARTTPRSPADACS